jgi:hypothetical protein
MRHVFVATMTAAYMSLALLAGTSFGQSERPKDVQPAPRWPDGRVNIASVPGQKGHWIRTRRELVVDASTTNTLPSDRKIEEIPFQPWAKALFEYRRSKDERDSPHARCKPSAGPRQIGTAYGFEMVEFHELQRVIIFDIGGPQTFRIIYMDGRAHPTGPDLIPTFYGHSIGRWEGDTLVVDTVGFNEENWIDAEGLMHTDQYHQIERFTRTDFKTLRYEVTIDDPGAYTAPWTAGFLLRWEAGAEIFEYICQENNKNPDMTIDDEGRPLSRANGHTP